MDVLEHIENDDAFLKELIMSLPVGGKILITVPAKKKLWSQHDVTAHHFRRYEMQEFTDLWKGMDVKPLCLSYFNSRLYALIRTARFIGNILNISLGKDKTDFSVPYKPINLFLTRIFAGEANRILRSMNNPTSRAYSYGVSLIVVLEKHKPSEIAT